MRARSQLPGCLAVARLWQDSRWGPRSSSWAVLASNSHACVAGALVTGMTNEDVARFLLQAGLKTMDACVFLDARDIQVRGVW